MPPGRRSTVFPPPADVAVAAIQLRGLATSHGTDSSDSMAERWYLLGAGWAPPVVIYGHQRASWERAIEELARSTAAELAAVDPRALAARWFSACEPPAPPIKSLERLLDHFKGGGGRPESFGVEARTACDPATLARRILAEDLGERARGELLTAHHGLLARSIYPSYRDYHLAVDDALYRLQHPAEAAGVGREEPVYEPLGEHPTGGTQGKDNTC